MEGRDAGTEEQPTPPVEEAKPEAAQTRSVPVDGGGAVVGYNPRPANSTHDRAALARFLEQWKARRRGASRPQSERVDGA
jgi:hypothetical protein